MSCAAVSFALANAASAATSFALPLVDADSKSGDKWAWDKDSLTLTLEDGFALSGDYMGGVSLPSGSSVNVEGSASISVSGDSAQFGMICYGGSLDINMSEDAVLSLTVKNPAATGYDISNIFGIACGALSINGEGSGNHKSLVSIDAGCGISTQGDVEINAANVETSGAAGLFILADFDAGDYSLTLAATDACLDLDGSSVAGGLTIMFYTFDSPDVSVDAPVRLYSADKTELYQGYLSSDMFRDVINWDIYVKDTVPSRLVSTFDVTFYDEDGTTVLKETQTVDWKDAAVPPADPTKAEDENYTYTFAGWDADFSRVAENLDVKATYAKTAKGGGSEIKAASAAINERDKTLTFDANGETRLTLTITPTNANEALTWASGDDGVVTITPTSDNLKAVLAAIGDGTTIVTVTGADGRILDRVVVTVTGTAPGNPTAKISGYTSGGGGGCSVAGFGVLALIAAAPAALRRRKK